MLYEGLRLEHRSEERQESQPRSFSGDSNRNIFWESFCQYWWEGPWSEFPALTDPPRRVYTFWGDLISDFHCPERSGGYDQDGEHARQNTGSSPQKRLRRFCYARWPRTSPAMAGHTAARLALPERQGNRQERYRSARARTRRRACGTFAAVTSHAFLVWFHSARNNATNVTRPCWLVLNRIRCNAIPDNSLNGNSHRDRNLQSPNRRRSRW